MKIILKIFSRNFLIRISYYLLPILKILYSGNKFIDPIDGKGYSKFLSYGYGKLRKNALSPGTLSLERHRLLWLYINKSTNLLNSKLKVLHIAPEQIFYKKFKKAGIEIVGISKDDVTSHRKFCDKMNIPYILLADVETEVCKKFGVWGLKKFMGREFMGINRSTFLVNEKGKIFKVFPKVKPKGHAKEVLEAFQK